MRKVTAGDRTWGQGDIRWTPARKFRQCKHCPLHWNYHTSFSSFGRICFPNQWFQTNFFKMLFFCRYNKSSIRLHWSFKEKDQLWGIVFIKFICSSWFEDFNMDPLIKATLLRTFGFILWVFLSTWVFVLIEDTEKDDREEKYELLSSLYHSMALKYNMTVEEFNNFSSVAFEALSEPKLSWSFVNAFDFVLQAVTTIGKAHIVIVTK